MKIVHVLSQVELTGAESYALTLAEWFVDNHHDVTIISDKLHSPTKAKYLSRPIHSKGIVNRLKNIFFLIQYIHKNKIDIIHAHSRASIRVAYWAVRLSRHKVALISTVHGKQHYSLSKRLFDLYGDRVLAVCENIRTHLLNDFKMCARKVYTLGNPLDTDKFKSTPSEQERKAPKTIKKIAIIGRFSGPKGENTKALIQLMIPHLLKHNTHIEFHILGMNPTLLGQETLNFANELSKQYTGRFQIYEVPAGQLDQLLSNFDLIIGAGRVAISSLIQQIPTIALGEALYHGLVTTANITHCLASNFGDISEKKEQSLLNLDSNRDILSSISNDIQNAIDLWPALDSENLSALTLERFEKNRVCQEVFEHYQSALFRKKFPAPIPVLMYHKIPHEELQTPHRIFVTKNNFEKHLQFYQKHQFTSLSFKELNDFRKGEKDLSLFPKKPLIITFDDGYENNLLNAIPLLKKYGFSATIFLLANSNLKTNEWDRNSGTPQLPLLNSSQRQELLKHGIEIGSHGFNHKRITTMTDDEAYHELKDSKQALESELNFKISTFAFTYGDTSGKHAELAKKAGYTFAVNTDTGGLHIEENPYSIFRISIFPEENNLSLWKKTSKWYRQYYYWKRKK